MGNRESEIAVVGIGLRFPGGIDTTEKLWKFLCDQGDASSEVPDDRWGSKRYYSADIRAPSKTYMRRGSFIDQNIAHMDPLFFGISPREAACMDPQQRLTLEVVWEAMEDSGILPKTYAAGRTGVFMGTFSLDWMGVSGSVYNRRLIKDHYSATAASVTMLAARVSHSLGLKGPSMSIDTACSSSLTAIHQACQSLASGESDAAIAGGVNIMVSPISSITMSKGHFLSVDGRCKSFSSMADGYGRGEGCGIVVLKRLADAERDGDKIHAVIVGTGVNQDGRTPTLTTPSEEAQRNLIAEVLSNAGLTPADVSYVEAHGTGTPVGDPIEVNALGKSIGQQKALETPLLIGSIKANIGHLEGAAGVAGLIKAILCLNRRAIPPQANLVELNKTMPFADLGIKVVEKELTQLPPSESEIFVGVNSFGYGGTNAVAFLRSPPLRFDPDRLQTDCPADPAKALLLPINAMAEAATQKLALSYLDLLRSSNGPAIEDLCFSAAQHRARLQLQTVICGASMSDIVAGLEAVAEKKAYDNVITGRRLGERSQKPVFVFSGMGSQWKGMGHHILRDPDENIQSLVRRVDSLFLELSGWSIIGEILRPASESKIDEAIIAQPAIFVIQIVLAAALHAKGITPSAIVGHSLGEVAAAYVAGALSLEDAIQVIYHRSRLQARLSGKGGMLAIALSGAEATSRFIGKYSGLVSVAAFNSDSSCTLAGDSDALRTISEFCHRDGIFNRQLNVTIPYHNSLMDEIHDELLDSITGIDPQTPQIRLYSTVTGEHWNGEGLHDASYWFTNAREPVLFHDAIQRAFDDDHQIFLEIGAHPVLSAFIREAAQSSSKDLAVIPTLRRNESECLAISRCIARLYIAGAPLNWSLLTGGRHITLPHYPWTREYFWSETEESRRDRLDIIVHPLLGNPVSTSSPVWHYDLNEDAISWVEHHQVDGICLFPAAGFIEGCIALCNQVEPSSALILENFRIPHALALDEARTVQVEWAFDPRSRILTVSSTCDVEENKRWIEHASCTLLASKPWNEPDISVPDADETNEIPIDEFYNRLHSLGFDYGSNFRVLKKLDVGDGAASAHLKLNLTEEVEDYYLHPTLLDGAFQALIGAAYNQDEYTVYIPTEIKQVIYWGGKHKELIAHARISRKSQKYVEGDIRLTTLEGEGVIQISGFRATSVPKGTNRNRKDADAIKFYRQTWLDVEQQALLIEAMKVTVLTAAPTSVSLLHQTFQSYGLTVETHDINKLEDPALLHILSDQTGMLIYISRRETAGAGEESIGDLLRLAQLSSAAGEGSTRKKLMVITQGAVTADSLNEEFVDIAQACIRGFTKGLSAERADLGVRLVDIGDFLQDEATVLQICAEVSQQDQEDDVILRPDLRAVGRICEVRSGAAPERSMYSQGEMASGEIVGVRLVSDPSGLLDKLHYERMIFEPPPQGKILFRTIASALNFKDVLKATHLLPDSVVDNTFNGSKLGMEASAEVISIGAGVDGFKPGQRYLMPWPGCFATHFYADAATVLAFPLEEPYSPEEAVTLPIAFVTAYYALIHLARLEAGETVLIHGGSGGVGLAAIQLARMVGANVFTTAGNEEKRKYLRSLGCEYVYDSRSLYFAAEINAVTSGKGVDVVLNSLSGEGQTHSLALLAPYGRFVEIGKKDIVEARSLPLTQFNNNLSFFSLDLDRLMLQRPALMRTLLTEVVKLARNGGVETLPYTSFPAHRTSEAFRFLASAKHIGKVVIDYTNLDELQADALLRPIPIVNTDGVYLVTGGLGGFGWATARWLIQKGATHLILVGRRAEEQSEYYEEILAYREKGIELRTLALDVSDPVSMADLFEGITQRKIPLKGIFHCAGILDDALIHNLDIDRIGNVLKPKVAGARLLDELSTSIDLDYFVLYSSITTLLGNLGQSAYIAANAALAAIVSNRTKRGQAALSVEWGAISDIGMLQRNESAARLFDTAGIGRMSAEEALHQLPGMLDFRFPVLACAKIDWEKWATVFPAMDSLPRFSQLRFAKAGEGRDGKHMIRLRELNESQRLDYIITQVKEIVSKILYVDVAKISDTARLSELGIDSLAGVELQSALRIEMGVDISVLMLARDETIQQMSQSFLEKLYSDNTVTQV